MQNPSSGPQGYGPRDPYSGQQGYNQNPQSGPGPGKTSMGLDTNVASLLAYSLTWITGLIFYLIEKDNRVVRFHAMQAILLGAVWLAAFIAFAIIGFAFVVADGGLLLTLLIPVRLVLGLGFLAIWIVCMIKAYQGQQFKLPIIGKMAEDIVSK